MNLDAELDAFARCVHIHWMLVGEVFTVPSGLLFRL